MPVRRCLNQLCRNPDPVSGAHDRTLYQRIHVQLACNFGNGFLCALVLRSRSPGNNAQGAEFSEIGRQSFG